jgi:CcmD family protein
MKTTIQPWRGRLGRRALAVVFALGLAAGPVTGGAAGASALAVQPNAQAQPAPDGFEPVTGAAAAQEQLPAAPLVMLAYAFVWVMVLFYVWSLWRRLGVVEKELAAVARRLGEGRRS